MTINQRQKGARAERSLADYLRTLGFDGARRTAQYNGNGHVSDIVCPSIPNLSIECKAVQGLTLGTEQFHAYFVTAERDAGQHKRAVMFWKPKNNGVWYMTFRDDKFGMMTLHESKDVAVALRMLDGEGKGESQ